MGEAYRARDSRLNRDVAIKVLHEEGVSSPELRTRFEREARSVGALNHPNIVGVYDFGIENGQQYIGSEVVDGGSLRSLLAGGPFPVRRLIDVATQIADGLAAAHAAGLVHRDLKPENIMLAEDCRVKIFDFGLARPFRLPRVAGSATGEKENLIETAAAPPGNHHITAAGEVFGTASYMSPEQALGKNIDYRSDQFFFGLVLHEMAAGKQAFAATARWRPWAPSSATIPLPLTRSCPLRSNGRSTAVSRKTRSSGMNPRATCTATSAQFATACRKRIPAHHWLHPVGYREEAHPLETRLNRVSSFLGFHDLVLSENSAG
jgi:serine/threonine protein kinase